MRDFTIDIGDPNECGMWNSGLPIAAIQGCNFGPAEETIALIEYQNGQFEVGIGDPLRPYIQVYMGPSAEMASKQFLLTILDRSGLLGGE